MASGAIRAGVAFQRSPQEPHVPGQALAGIADEQVQPQRNSLAQRQGTIHPL